MKATAKWLVANPIAQVRLDARTASDLTPVQTTPKQAPAYLFAQNRLKRACASEQEYNMFRMADLPSRFFRHSSATGDTARSIQACSMSVFLQRHCTRTLRSHGRQSPSWHLAVQQCVSSPSDIAAHVSGLSHVSPHNAMGSVQSRRTCAPRTSCNNFLPQGQRAITAGENVHPPQSPGWQDLVQRWNPQPRIFGHGFSHGKRKAFRAESQMALRTSPHKTSELDRSQ